MHPRVTDSATALIRAVRARFALQGVDFAIEELRSRSWASVTFAGARHELAFRVEGERAEDAAGCFLGGLDAAEFSLRGHMLADIALVSEERRPDRVRIALEALTVEER
jgi:hypothetical protein